MIKGPKAILSSAISNALSEYFIIDPSTNIESNLLHDAKIVLRHVQLKPQRSIIPLGTNDNDDDNGFTDTATTIATTTGSVDKVVFSWTWSVGYGSGGDTGEWIRDALLLIEGAKFECCLEKHDYFDVQPTDIIINNDDDSKTASLSSSFVNPTTIDDKSAKTIKSTPGGISGFVSRQIEMVIDNLTLRMVDFELKIIVAVSSPPPSGDVASSDGKGSATTTRSFLIGVDQVELLSFGRKTTTIASGDGMATTTLLKQRINLRSFRSSILIGRNKEDEGSSTTIKGGVEGDDGNVQNLINELAFLPTNISSVGGKEEHDSMSEVDAKTNNNSNVKEDEYHLIEPFSYSADVTRMGSRFSGFMTGVEVVGIVPSSDDDEDDNGAGGIAVHMGNTQVESLVLLGEMILAPSTPSSSSSNSEESSEGGMAMSPSSVLLSTEESEIKPNVAASENDPSSFILPLSFATLVADDKTFSVSAISIKYKADGTICQFDAKKVSYESIDGGRAEASNIYASMRPAVKMIIDSIDTLHIPDVALLEKPVEFTELKYEGNTLTARFHEIEMITLGKGQDSANGGSPTKLTTKQSAKVSSVSKSEVGHKQEPASASTITAPKLPFSLDISVKGCHIKKSADGSSMKMANFQLFCNENKVENSSDVALNIGHFKNHLASVSDVYLCASFPFDAVNCINALNLSVRDATIVSGHSVEDWQESFQPKYKSKAAKSSSSAPSPVIKLPNAAIADMKLAIVLKTNVGVNVKQTPLTIKAFNGKDATTSKDVINHYTMACLSRVPEFISNAEVLGLNVVDNTAATWGNFVGLATPFGGFTGLAAVVGVDAVKNTVSAGKRGRGKSEGDNYEASDVARGLFQAAKEATHRGATMRGKKDNKGNVIDWAVGATTTTTEYVGENKTRLGGAAAGGGGFFIGMALGGPVGAIIGGLVATAATGKTLETIDEHQKKKIEIEQPKLTNK